MKPLILALALCTPAFAQSLELVEDIDTTKIAVGSSSPSSPNFEQEWFQHDSFVEMAGSWYFSATTPEFGRELWRTDGTQAGTVLVADIHPNGDSNPKELITLGGHVYFMADDGVHGSELWRTDGTLVGTELVADINPGPQETLAQNFVVFGNLLVFNADGPNAGQQPWRSDGTAAGTYRIAKLGAEPHAYPKWFTPDSSGTRLFFTASPVFYQELLFVTDGTTAGTHQLQPAGGGLVEPIGFQNIGGVTLFQAKSSGNKLLWVTDGTSAGTHVLNDVNGQPVRNPGMLFAMEWNGKLYFDAVDGTGSALWATDGTSAGTHVVHHFSDTYGPRGFTAMGGKLYFTAVQPLPIGRELHVFDGVSVQLVTNLTPGKNTFKTVAGDMVATGGWLAFEDGDAKRLFRSNGTAAGTAELSGALAALTSIDWLTPIGGQAVLFVATVDGVGRELFRADLGTGVMELLADIDPQYWTASSGIVDLRRLGTDKLVFHARDEAFGFEPRKWSPEGGVELLADIYPGASGSVWLSETPRLFPGFVGDYGWLFYAAHSSDQDFGLWKTNGLAANTKRVANLAPDFSHQSQIEGFSDGKRFYFKGDLWPFIGELFATDGSLTGTVLAGDFNPTGTGSPEILGATQRGVFVSAYNSVSGYGLYINSGTPASTQLLMTFDTPGLGNPVEHPLVVDERIYFRALTTTHGKELWVSDGTPAGTQMVVDLAPGSADSDPRGLFEFNGRCLFFAFDANGLASLWSVDAGGSLTELASGLLGFQAVTDSFAVARLDGLLFFAANGGPSQGTELWLTDGTPLGTRLAAEVIPGSGSSMPRELVAANGGVYFTAESDEYGRELHFYDHATGAVSLVEDLYPGPVGSDPEQLVLVGGQLLFTAEDPFFGRELFSLSAPGPYVVDLGMAVSSVELTASTPRLGTTLTFQARNIPVGAVAALIFSKPRELPGLFYTEFGQACWIDAGSLSILRVFTSSEWSYDIALPVLPALVGAAFSAQVYASDQGLLPARTSNAIGLHLDH